MKKVLSLAVVFCLLASLFSGMTVATAVEFSGDGSGIADDPYIITSTAEFLEISNNLNAHYRLKLEDGSILLPADYLPIEKFSGTLEGVDGGNTIQLQMDGTQPAFSEVTSFGLFGSLNVGATIKNVELTGYVTGRDGVTQVAGLAGCTNSGGGEITIDGVTNRADITSRSTALNTPGGAGLVGVVNATSATRFYMKNCVNYGAVCQADGCQASYLAGLVSQMGSNESYLENCYNYGEITGSSRIAGIIGYIVQQTAEVRSCGNYGSVTAVSERAAGIAAYMNKGSVSKCFNAGKISGSYTAGIVYQDNYPIAISDCFNAGEIYAVSGTAAGIVTVLSNGTTVPYSSLTRCYNVGTVGAAGGVSKASPIYANITNANVLANISDCYYIPESCGNTASGDIVAKKAIAISQDALSAELPSCFSEEVWELDKSSGSHYPYPQLKENYYVPVIEGEDTEHFAGGNGTALFPYEIASAAHFQNIALFPSAFYTQVQNLEEPITSPLPEVFTGSYNGNDFTIPIAIDNGEGEQTGLFSDLSGATVKNLVLTGNVLSSGQNTGALAGIAGSSAACTLENIINKATVSGGKNTGGLAGTLTSNTSVVGCRNEGCVTGGNYVGGLFGVVNTADCDRLVNSGDVSGTYGIGGIAGTISAPLTNSYNIGDITGGDSVGGISGLARSSFTNCYNCGRIQAVSNTAGGLGYVGHNNATSWTNCYNTGDLIAPEGAAQLVASNNNNHTLDNCYYLTPSPAEAPEIMGAVPVDREGLKTANLGAAYIQNEGAEYPYPQLTNNPQMTPLQFALLSVSTDENGAASFAGSKYVKSGIQYPLTFTANDGFELGKVTVNGTELPGVTESVNIPVNGDTTVHAVFTQRQAVAPGVTAVAKPFVPDAGNSSYTFAAISRGYGYQIIGYGIIYSEDQAVITASPEECEIILEHKTEANESGQFGIQLIGALPSDGYYTRAYVTYQDADTQAIKTVYSDIVVEVR